MFLFVPYSILFLVTLLLLMFALALMLRRNAWKDRVNRLLLLWLISGLEWNFCALFESMALEQSTKILLSQLEYIGALCCTPFMFLFALRFTHFTERIRPWVFAAVFAPTVAGYALVLSNSWHHLIWTGFVAGPVGTNSLLYAHGSGYWGILLIIFAFGALASALFIGEIRRSWRVFRQQSVMLLTVITVSLLFSIIYSYGGAILPGLDLTPLGMSVTAVLLSFGIFNLRLFDLRALARDQLMEHIQDGVLVLDRLGRLVDFNLSAKEWLSPAVHLVPGEPFPIPDLWEQAWQKNAGQPGDLYLPAAVDMGRWLELRRSTITGVDKQQWTIITLRDITDRKLAEERLREQYHRILDLEASLREQAFRDSLTGLHNRRYLDETLRREIIRVCRDKDILSVLMLDIDRFKDINDHYGHAVGDQVLVGIGGLLKSFFRDSDVTCRYGGEEFVVILLGTGLEAALLKAEQLRQSFAGMDLGQQFKKIPTISIGVASFPAAGTDADALLKSADLALYQAKEGGRNQVRASTGFCL